MSLTSRKLKSLPDLFANLSSLVKLLIATDEDLRLPESFGNLSSLQELSLYADVTALPKSLGNCDNIKFLRIDSDKLTKLPESFSKLLNLQNIHLDTFALKFLPDSFGSFTNLEKMNIFSGALTHIPESIGHLKNLNLLWIDAYNAKELPDSFKNLSYIKHKDISVGKTLQESSLSRFHDNSGNYTEFEAKFNEMRFMGRYYLNKIIEEYSLKDLELLLLCAPSFYSASERDKEIVETIMLERFGKLSDNFIPTKKIL